MTKRTVGSSYRMCALRRTSLDFGHYCQAATMWQPSQRDCGIAISSYLSVPRSWPNERALLRAPVAELVDALDSKSSFERSVRSSRTRGTSIAKRTFVPG